MSLSSTLAKVSAKVIKQFGTTVTFTHKVQASFDPGTGTQVNNDTVFFRLSFVTFLASFFLVSINF